MPLTQEKRDEIIDLLVSNIPASAFMEVVREQGIVTNYDVLRKQAPDDLTEARQFIANSVITTYEAANKVAELASALYRRVYLDDYLAPRLAAFAVDADAAMNDAAKQAAIVSRANTMSQRELRLFMADNESKICVVMAADERNGAAIPMRLGTGFLVGPDAVLTAYHTLSAHIAAANAKLESPGRCCAVFDYYSGDPLTSFDKIPASCRVVEFHKDWLISANEDMPQDGLFRAPNSQQLQLLPTRLDFALIKLADPIGKQTRQRAGGARRSWIRVCPPAVNLRQDDRIIIPQHPNGYHLRIDFGRFSQTDSDLDTSKTRMRYDTETDTGTSGAPCFDHRFMLVGMHNASFRPDMVDVRKNQAIRIANIHTVIAALVAGWNSDAGASVQLWNTSTTEQPRVILGRSMLLDWLTNARNEATTSAMQRVYAADVKPEDRVQNSGFGKSFTIEILGAATRGRAEPVVVLGTERDQLPDSVPDMIAAIAFHLGIEKQFLATMPERPSPGLPSGTPNNDKLERWASHDVPEWFNDVMAAWGEQQFDQVQEAKERVQAARNQGQLPNPNDLDLSQEPGPKMATRRRWPLAWIVINLAGAELSKEVQDLLAGLIGAKVEENAMPRQLRRLRWLFVGDAPDNFLAPDQYTHEVLDPRQIGVPHIITAIKNLADSRAFELTDNALLLAEAMVELFTAPNGHPAVLAPTTRLPYLQETVFPTIVKKLKPENRP
jgi:hypothetical protein